MGRAFGYAPHLFIVLSLTSIVTVVDCSIVCFIFKMLIILSVDTLWLALGLVLITWHNYRIGVVAFGSIPEIVFCVQMTRLILRLAIVLRLTLTFLVRTTDLS